ncbi:MAG: Ig-like domain-containing protein [Candidatus Thermoplasmatota archaeon]|nr:Ig-like domain-containing protein [Candidatus Thermoplasmatota archaeon]
MRKTACIVIIILLVLTLIPIIKSGTGTPYTVRTYVFLDGSPVNGATVKVTLTKPDPDVFGYAQKVGKGIYDAQLGNSPYSETDWFNGDPIRVDVRYGDYYAWGTASINVAEGFTHFNISLSEPSNNTSPDKPTNPSPNDGETNVSLNPTLSVDVTDPDNDTMDVSFYDASDNLIGTDTNVASGSTASVEWSNLAYNTTYSWYAVADDGIYTNKSDTWHFTTVEPPLYTLTMSVSPEGGGSVTLNPDKSSYEEGEEVILTALPNAGYVFDKWSGDLVGTNSVKTIHVYKNLSIIARFKPVQYNMNVSVEPNNTGSVSLEPSGGIYGAGTNVTITANANAGYAFSYWSGNISGNENPVSITMDSNKSITAHFVTNYPPNVEITSPIEGANLSGVAIVQGTASDENGNETVQKVEIKIDNGSWCNATGTITWNFSWDTTTVDDGEHTIYARAYDGMNYSGIEEINVTVNNNRPPSMPIISGVSYGLVDVSYPFYAVSTDPDNDTIRYGFDWNDNGTVDEWTGFYFSGHSAHANYSWNETGNHSIKVIAEDEHGVQSEWSEPFSFTLFQNDTAPPSSTCELGKPTANLSYGGDNYTATKICTPMWINASDGNGSGVEWLNYSVWWNATLPTNYQQLCAVNISDNDENDTDNRTGFISKELHFEEECFHEIKWDVVDYLGHQAVQKSIDIAVDGTAPTINKTIGEPKYIDGKGWTWVNCSTNITLHVTDDGCGGGVGVWKFGINVYWNETRVAQGQVQEFTLIDTIVVEDNDEHDIDPDRGSILYTFHFSQECFYELKFWAVDYVGNNCTSKEKYMVDCTPSTSRVDDIIPYEQEDVPFNIAVIDIEDHGCEESGPIGVCKVEVYYLYDADNESWGNDWELCAINDTLITHPDGTADNWTLSFTAPEGAGWYRFKSIAYDCLGNEEQPPFYYGTYDAECYLNISLVLTFGEPEYGGWISLHTPVNISIINKDIEDIIGIYYRIYNNESWSPLPGDGVGNGNNFYLYTGNFTLSGFGCSHGSGLIEFYGNGTNVQNASFKLDALPPSTYFDVDVPFLVCESLSAGVYGYDEGAGIAGVEFYYRYSCDNSTWGNWTLAYADSSSPYNFNFSPDVGFYELSIIGIDFLGNNEQRVVKDMVRVFSPDVNGDGRVNILDIVMIASHWQEHVDGDEHSLDLNGDSIINMPDLILAGQYWTG